MHWQWVTYAQSPTERTETPINGELHDRATERTEVEEWRQAGISAVASPGAARRASELATPLVPINSQSSPPFCPSTAPPCCSLCHISNTCPPHASVRVPRLGAQYVFVLLNFAQANPDVLLTITCMIGANGLSSEPTAQATGLDFATRPVGLLLPVPTSGYPSSISLVLAPL